MFFCVGPITEVIVAVIVGERLLSKLSQLKQDAYQAGKKRDWETAVSIYERILELDKSNPSLVNELGDLCLKTGDVRSAVRHFLSAASKYRTNGLLNNAVAIYKKILRHDESNLNAHWYLAETRASQGLLVEGEIHGVQFLENSSHVSGDIKEIFLKRCVQLFELYSSSVPIMEQLQQIFRMWEMQLEAARVSCILACQRWDAGEEDRARQSMEKVLSGVPDVVKYPEYSQWMVRINPTASGAEGSYSDVNALDLGMAPEPMATLEPSQAEEPAQPVEPALTEESFQTVERVEIEEPIESVDPFGTATPMAVPADALPAADNSGFGEEAESIDDGYHSIESDTEVSFDTLISQATANVPVVEEKSTPSFDGPFAAGADEISKSDHQEPANGEPVDLLAQILADDTEATAPGESNQVTTITEEIGAKVGAGAEGDEGSLYEMGLVYLEMDMFDQACESFEKAACYPDYAIRAHEMWGITLLRCGKVDEAVAILVAGLDLPENGSKQQLGMLYHLGLAQEKAGRLQEAEDCYTKIYKLDRSFLDVGKRLARLSKV